jgi:putative Holliday junction resolvase
MLGLDVGEARIGVAVSDPTGTLCTALEALTRTRLEDDLSGIAALADEHECVGIVVGLPISMSGQRGSMARSVLAFVRRLRMVTPLPVETWDERLSTAEAESRLKEAGISTGRLKGRVDSAAAAIVLQSYLAAHG